MHATRHEQVNTWITTVSSQMPHLSKPQATVLALWSFAAVIAQSASMILSALLLAGLLGQKANTLRQRLKEFYKPKTAKKGDQRQELDVEACFAPLLSWVLRLWPSQQIALALDPTLCRDRFVCLSVSLVYDGGSIPLAWTILPANTKGAWKPHWGPLLGQLKQAMPSSLVVIVLCDRGLFARDLFAEIQALGLHPMMRLNKLGTWQPLGQSQWYGLPQVLPHAGCCYRGAGVLFKSKGKQLRCTLVAVWEVGYAEPWYLATDLAPAVCTGAWYGLRAWIEQGFRCIKSFGMQWERCRITAPERLERLWLVYALALLWTQAIAGQIEADSQAMVAFGLRVSDLRDRRGRRISRFRLGFVLILVALLNRVGLPMPEALHPAPWPVTVGCRRVHLVKEQQAQKNLPL